VIDPFALQMVLGVLAGWLDRRNCVESRPHPEMLNAMGVGVLVGVVLTVVWTVGSLSAQLASEHVATA
jgi:hypothetical protein